jgi:MFS family permease
MPFAGLFFFSTLARAMLISVLPLQSLALLGDAQKVSLLYFAVSVGGICASVCVPLVVRLLGYYPTFLSGMLAMAMSALLLSTNTLWLFTVGFFCHAFAIAMIEVSLSLYVMQRIARQELSRFEPLRMLSLVGALAIGPWLGVYLEARVAHWLPYAAATAATLVTIVYFRVLGLHNTRTPASSTTRNPLLHLQRFFRQPRLRLAWGLTMGRSAWWMTFIIYTPIYAEQTGIGDLTGAAVVSIGSAWTLSVPWWGWVARRYGTRRLLVTGFTITSALSLAVFALAGYPWVAIALLVLAALGATILDGAGNVLFLRAVRPLERAEMSGVFLTYRDAANLAAPGTFAVLLKFFALPVVFAGAASWMLIGALYSRYIPRRM